VTAARYLYAFIALSVTVLAGCGAPPGQPQKGSESIAPNEVLEFGTLYGQNCAACHGADGRGGAAIALANPVYLAIADDTAIRAVVANGVRGTSMPAFAQRAGGMLTEKQIDSLVGGIRSRWSRPGALDGARLPSYAPTSTGDVRRGETAYRTFCESCHGPDGGGGPKGSAITNDSFLALTSDQGLRTMVIAGRPELGAPDWRGNLAGPALSGVEGPALSPVEGRPMSDQDVTDVVSWLTSHRAATPGQPYFTAQIDQR
jgi:cytochrome c oxidase cbb3-type subunit 3